jgi:hypothetical protein
VLKKCTYLLKRTIEVISCSMQHIVSLCILS